MHDNYKNANAARRCSHVLSTGNPCTQPALHERHFCRFHDPIGKVNRRCEIPIVEDAPSLQVAYAEVVNALVTGKIDRDSAELCFVSLRMASDNLKEFLREMEWSEASPPEN